MLKIKLKDESQSSFYLSYEYEISYLRELCIKHVCPKMSLSLCRMLRNNKISCIHNGSFTGLTNVRLLSLYDNQLSTILPGAFDTLPNLSTLLVTHPQIRADTLSVCFHLSYLPTMSACPLETFWPILLNVTAVCPGLGRGLEVGES